MSEATPSTKNYEVWGLTGGIAAGKSAAARIFEQEGIPVIDADKIARELGTPGGAAHPDILSRFGTDDRAKLRQIVFADPQARKDLEAILHPRIVAESQRRMEEIASRHRGPGRARILYEAALLVETGRYRDLDGLIVIDAPREVRRTRLIERDGATPELADRILSAQIPDEARIQAATAVIQNADSLEELRAAIHVWLSRMGWR